MGLVGNGCYMTTYIIIAAVVLVLFVIIRSMNRIMGISSEATMLVAFVKYAREKKSSIFDKNKSQEEFDKEKYEKLQVVCFLLHRILPKIQKLREMNRFNIRENGPQFGQFIEVKAGPFMEKIMATIQEIKLSLPPTYQVQIDDYLKNPMSEKNQELSKSIKEKWFSNDKYLKKLSDNLRNGIINQDYLYVLCGNCK